MNAAALRLSPLDRAAISPGAGGRFIRFRVFLRLAIALVFFVGFPSLLYAGPIFPAPYSHYSNQEPLGQVLADFARVEGYHAMVSGALEGKLSGRFDKLEGWVFLEGLERAFGARWYVLDKTLYFYHARELARVFISAQATGAREMHRQLTAMGLVSAQLPLEIAEGADGLLAVSGPPAYVAQIQAMAEALEKAAEKSAMRVFKLKYASADDLKVDSMGRSVTIPGVASILRAMVNGQNSPGASSGLEIDTQKATVEKLKGSGLAARGNEAVTQSGDGAAEGSKGGRNVFNIVADPRVNAVIVQDTQARMPYYEQVIADLDRETHLVEIHAAIVDIDSDFKRDLGVSWQGRHVGSDGNWSGGGDVSTPESAAGLLPEAGAFAGGGAILSTIYTHGDNFFLARVQAMEKTGAARMLGRPSILTADHLEATLENITTYYISVSGREEVDLFKVESGTVLRVTPHIIENGEGEPSIRLAVTVQDDQESDAAGGLTGSMAIPPIKQTKINTQAIVDAGQSLLIGGYYFEEKQESRNGVPVLMHVPILGHLFRSTTRNTRQMERLVLITPRIARPGEIRALPSQVTEANFRRDPARADYESREFPPTSPPASEQGVQP
jgi:type III secretion protein C